MFRPTSSTLHSSGPACPPAGIPQEEFASYAVQFAALDGDGDGFLSASDGRTVLSKSVSLLALICSE
jgi:hypothetical protein